MIARILLFMILPYSDAFYEANIRNLFPNNLLYLIISCFWISLTIVFFARKSPKNKLQTALELCLSLFFIYAVLGQAEILIFKNLFLSLDRANIVCVILSRGIPVIITIILAVILFQNEYNYSKYLRPIKNMTFADGIIKPIFMGICYVIIYLVVNYYIAERVEAVRLFYTGKSEYPEFFARLIDYRNTTPALYGILFIKGTLFGIFILPIVNMFRRRPSQMLTAIVLIYETTAALWLIPNRLFPDAVRMAHFYAAIVSMLAFAFISWILFNRLKIKSAGE
ncbi:MAG: hypothetical protein FWF52_08545 [Candidatus Azobacteroides sp.]|nr:hypothetical protein [Candidatus Azobacteroides sp.]